MASVTLPAPDLSLPGTLAAALARRRSIREFAELPLSLAQTGQLLWAAQGVSDPSGRRTAPSAGALYPLELCLVAGRVEGLANGVYRYRPASHTLDLLLPGDLRRAVAAAALGQEWMARAAAILLFTALPFRTTGKYGRRGIRYLHIEAGHAAQNVLLQAVCLDLAGAVVGAFDDLGLAEAVAIRPPETPLYLVPVGRSAISSCRPV
ncbi:MAG: SagB/ThcOx family dehydrogenase [Gammaproteobacteria bacterium]|nr:MAG: SagB/ThcOx family dehydrogenase [Gammaproteobacteria bacterium]